MTPESVMQRRADKRAAAAQGARDFAAEFVADLESGVSPRQLRIQLVAAARERKMDPTDLWIAVRDQMRTSGVWAR